MTMCEFNSEESNKGVDVIVSTTVQLERSRKGKIFFLDCVQINFLKKNHKLKLCVDKRQGSQWKPATYRGALAMNMKVQAMKFLLKKGFKRMTF